MGRTGAHGHVISRILGARGQLHGQGFLGLNRYILGLRCFQVPQLIRKQPAQLQPSDSNSGSAHVHLSAFLENQT